MGLSIDSPALHGWKVNLQDLIAEYFFKLDNSLFNIEVWLIILNLSEGNGLVPQPKECSNLPVDFLWDIKVKFYIMWQEVIHCFLELFHLLL